MNQVRTTRKGNGISAVHERRSPLAIWERAIRRSTAGPPVKYDPGFMARILPFMELFASYFDAEVRGLEQLPKSGPMLVVGNHSGGIFTPDTSALYAAWYKERGMVQPLMGLAFDAAFTWPGIGDVLPKIGQMPASHENAHAAFEAGASLLVYPGGAHEVFRPWTERNKVDLNGRKGFIKLALRAGVPVVPVVGHGGHHTAVVLARGERIARLLGMNRLRIAVCPIMLQFPWGVWFAGPPCVPIPAKITMQAHAPMAWSHLTPEDAEDPAVVDACYKEISALMQTTMDQLAAENPRPLLSRLRSLLPGRRSASRRPSFT